MIRQSVSGLAADPAPIYQLQRLPTPRTRLSGETGFTSLIALYRHFSIDYKSQSVPSQFAASQNIDECQKI
jgi:hypothetical protein